QLDPTPFSRDWRFSPQNYAARRAVCGEVPMKARGFLAGLLTVLTVLGAAVPAAQADQGRASLSGTVYFDANVNGRPDPQERAIRNVQLDLVGQGYRESRKSGENGAYEFNNLVAGQYVLSIKLPSGYGLSAGENDKQY